MDEKYLKHIEDVFGPLGVKLIASEVSGLNYAIDDDRKGIVIIGKYGKTFLECMRLQTVPEWYEFPVSNSQAYKMLGNGWTVDVIAHILKGLKEA